MNDPVATASVVHRHGGRGPRSRAAVVVLLLAGMLAVAGALVLHLTAGQAASRPAAVPVVDRGSLPTTGSTARPAAPAVITPSPHGTRTASHGLPAGSRLTYARLGVDAPITRVTVMGHVMDVPRDPSTLGWWRDGAAPGDAAGSAVVVGHINYAGQAGALAVLPRARPGDRITVVEPRTRITYRVSAVRTYPKSSGLPAAAFARTGAAQLVLITCGGPFDASTGNYEDNVVVYAEPV